MQKDQMQTLEEAKDVLKKAGVADDEMAVLERQLLPPANDPTTKDTGRQLGFVSAGLQQNGGETTANREDIELPEDSESEDEDKVEIAQKEVPAAVFGGLVRKRDEEAGENGEEGNETNTKERTEDDGHLGARERFKKRRGA